MNKDDFKHINYRPETGLFYSTRKIERTIGTPNKLGYIVLRIKNKTWYAHRLAFFLYHGFLPKMIDHINGIKSDNRICNLREANYTINNHNRKAKGYTKPKQTKKWSASITVNRVRKHLGYFNTPEDAHKAYLEAKQIHHPTAPH